MRIINLSMAQQGTDRQPLNAIERHTAATAQGIMDMLRKLNMPAIVELPK